jgi:hypothetical protein
MRVAIWACAAAAAIGACGKKSGDDKKASGTPRPQPKLTVTLDGKPVTMATALAWKRADGDIEVTASSVAVTCAEVTGEMREMHDDEVTFNVGFSRMMKADGSMVPVVNWTSFAASTDSTHKPAAAASGDGAPGQPTTIAVDFSADATSRAAPGQKLVVKGTVDALGCDVPPAKNIVALPPEQPATLVVAGKKLAIRGARIDTDKVGDVSFTLSTGGETCARKDGEQPSPLVVTVSYRHDEPAKIDKLELSGPLLGSWRYGLRAPDAAKAIVKPSPPAAGEVELAIDVPVGDYPVKLEGKVTAVACPKSS